MCSISTPAALDRVGTARVEVATRRRIDRARYAFLPFDRRVGNRNRQEERLGIGMQRLREQRLLVGIFDDAAEIHHRDAVTDMIAGTARGAAGSSRGLSYLPRIM